MASAGIQSPKVLAQGPLKRAATTLLQHWERLSLRSRVGRFHGGVGDDWLRERSRSASPDLLLGVEADGETRAVAELYKTTAVDAEVALSVEDAYQSRGFGRELFAAVIEHARKMGVHRIEASFSHDNRPMLRLAQNAGAEIVAEDGDRWASITL
ncbi:GNAT family N-acetyltransferase [Roseivivax sp. CAU 1761]